METVFHKHYIENKWGKGSGIGSFPINTTSYRNFVSSFIRKNHVKSIADIGCGDWEIFKLVDLSSVDYVGYDCVKMVIEENRKQYPGFQFVHKDLTQEPINQYADLIIIKDVLAHLSFSSIEKLTQNLSSFTYLMTVGDYTTSKKQQDITDGGYRALNYNNIPFYDFGNLVYTYTMPHPKYYNRRVPAEKVIFLKVQHK